MSPWAALAVAPLLFVAACDASPPAAQATADPGIAAAERQAVGDTDAALKDATAPQAVGTINGTDRFSR